VVTSQSRSLTLRGPKCCLDPPTSESSTVWSRATVQSPTSLRMRSNYSTTIVSEGVNAWHAEASKAGSALDLARDLNVGAEQCQVRKSRIACK
jgi:hypothetical protein